MPIEAQCPECEGNGDNTNMSYLSPCDTHKGKFGVLQKKLSFLNLISKCHCLTRVLTWLMLNYVWHSCSFKCLLFEVRTHFWSRAYLRSKPRLSCDLLRKPPCWTGSLVCKKAPNYPSSGCFEDWSNVCTESSTSVQQHRKCSIKERYFNFW